jgi:hypothetical protein
VIIFDVPTGRVEIGIALLGCGCRNREDVFQLEAALAL